MTPSELSFTFLNNLAVALKEKSQREVFYFADSKKSGVNLEEVKLPEQGFGFFGWMRLEKKIKENSSKDYCIWKFTSQEKYSFRLNVKDGKVVFSSENKEMNKEDVEILSDKLIMNKWYFVELYFIPNEASNNLVCFGNNHLVVLFG